MWLVQDAPAPNCRARASRRDTQRGLAGRCDGLVKNSTRARPQGRIGPLLLSIGCDLEQDEKVLGLSSILIFHIPGLEWR